MATAPSNGRKSDSKEHHSYSDEYMHPIQDWSSGREVPVLAQIGSTIRSEQFVFGEYKPDDQVVPRPSIAQPTMPSSSSVVEERYSQNPYSTYKMKVRNVVRAARSKLSKG